MTIQFFLYVIAILLLTIFWELSKINSRLKERFPTAKEAERELSKSQPMASR